MRFTTPKYDRIMRPDERRFAMLDRPDKLPPKARKLPVVYHDEPARPVLRIKNSGYHTFDKPTTGTAESLVGLDLVKSREYHWRGKGNKEARKLWARIKDQLPTPEELARMEKAARAAGWPAIYAPGTEPPSHNLRSRGES